MNRKSEKKVFTNPLFGGRISKKNHSTTTKDVVDKDANISCGAGRVSPVTPTRLDEISYVIIAFVIDVTEISTNSGSYFSSSGQI